MKRKLAPLVLVVAIIAGLLGCSATTTPTAAATTAIQTATPATPEPTKDTYDIHGLGLSAPGAYPIVTTAVTFTGLGNEGSSGANFEKSLFFPWYEKKTGVHIEWTTVPDNTMAEKVVLLLASDDYPDIICNPKFGTQGEVKYGSQGYLVNLRDYISKYGFNIQKVFNTYPDILPGSITAVDGSIYAFPNINECYHCMRHNKAWINTAFLKNVGLSMPTTTDELYNVLVAFKEKDANGNGNPSDEIPMLGYFTNNSDYGDYAAPQTWLLNSFMYYDGTNLEIDGGKVAFTSTCDEMREGLRYIAKLFKEGLLDPTSLTMTEDMAKELILNNPDPIVGIYFCLSPLMAYDDTPDHRLANIDGLAPVAGPKGVRNTPLTGTPVINTALVITDKCKYPEVAVRWVDGLYDEDVTLTSQLGTEGLCWERAKPGQLGIDGKQAIYSVIDKDDTSYYDSSMSNRLVAFRSNAMRMGAVVDYSDPLSKYIINPLLQRVSEQYYTPYLPDPAKKVPVLYMTESESTEYARLKEQIDTYVDESMAAFMMGTMSLDTDWDSYVSELNGNLKVDSYVALIQTAYDRQYKK